MQKYMGGLVLLGVFPLLYCLIYYFRDSIDYITLEEGVDVEDTDIFMWQVRISFYFYYKMFMLGTQGIKQNLFKPRSMNQTMQKLSFIIRRVLIIPLFLPQELPYGLMWYSFVLVALQVHGFSLYFAWNLVQAWKIRTASRKLQQFFFLILSLQNEIKI